jgi:hypothetical protein
MNSMNRRDYWNDAVSLDEESDEPGDIDFEDGSFEDAVADKEYLQKIRAFLDIERDLLI